MNYSEIVPGSPNLCFISQTIYSRFKRHFTHWLGAALLMFAGTAYADHTTEHDVQSLKGGLGAIEQRLWDCENGVGGACPGTTGPQGTAGTDGVDGLAGAQGPAGPQGSAGTDGTDGLAGAPGANGLAGTDGLAGAQGPAGPQGSAGADGTDGTDGLAGADGVDGAQGPEGPPGIDFDPFVIQALVKEAVAEFAAERQTRNPDFTDNNFQVGKIWINTTTPQAFILLINDSNGAAWRPVTSFYQLGDRGPAGGVVFSIDDSGLHGYEVTPMRVLPDTKWGCNSQSVGMTSRDYGSGPDNTLMMLDSCSPGEVSIATVAREFTINGLLGWVIPSPIEINRIYHGVPCNVDLFARNYCSPEELFGYRQLIASLLIHPYGQNEGSAIHAYWTSHEVDASHAEIAVSAAGGPPGGGGSRVGPQPKESILANGLGGVDGFCEPEVLDSRGYRLCDPIIHLVLVRPF